MRVATLFVLLLAGAGALRVPLAAPRRAHDAVTRAHVLACEGEAAGVEEGEGDAGEDAPAAAPEPAPAASTEMKKDLKDFAAPAATVVVLLGGAFALNSGGDAPPPKAAAPAVQKAAEALAPSAPAKVEKAPEPAWSSGGYQAIPDVWKM